VIVLIYEYIVEKSEKQLFQMSLRCQRECS